MIKDPMNQLLIDHEAALLLTRHKYTSKRSKHDAKRSWRMDNRLSQHEAAVISRGFETGGFPVGKRQLIKIFDQNAGADFYELRDRMRNAIQQIEHNNLTMEQVSSVAHICAVVAYKLEPKS